MRKAHGKLMMVWAFLAYRLRAQSRSEQGDPGELWDQNN